MVFESDKFYEWSDKSKDIEFKSNENCVGNGEKKLAKELDIITEVGGQNSVVDLIDSKYGLGNISVKDMTNDSCTLGTEGCKDMRKIFRTILNPFVCWAEKYKNKCEFANKYFNDINNINGSSRTTILNGIDRCELSKSNISKLNDILEKLKENFNSQTKSNYISLKSEYIIDVVDALKVNSLQEKLNECVRNEAIKMTLIIVHKKKGWIIVKDTTRLSCPRITRGAPRIKYNFPENKLQLTI